MQYEKEKAYYCPLKNLPTCNDIYLERSAHSEHSKMLEKIPSELVKKFIFKKKLGSGAFGVVFQIYDGKENMNKAIKLLNLVKMEEIKTELKVLLRLHHQYIVRYFKSGVYLNKAYIVMEACDMDLHGYLIQNKKSLTYEKKIAIFIQICEGIKYFHYHPEGEIVHRDLKLGNILMKGNIVRISDFGEAKIIENSSDQTGIKGTMSYLPPELLFLDSNVKVIASPKHDIWSLGILAHQIFAEGQHPFKTSTTDNLWKRNVMDGKYLIDYKYIVKGSPIDLTIQGCLAPSPQKRLNIIDVLELFSSTKITKCLKLTSSSPSSSSSSASSSPSCFHFPEPLSSLKSKKENKIKKNEPQEEKESIERGKKKKTKLEGKELKKEKIKKKEKNIHSEQEKQVQPEREEDDNSEQNKLTQLENDKKFKLKKEKQSQAKKKKEEKNEFEEEKKLEPDRRQRKKKYEKEQQLEEKKERKIKVKIVKKLKPSSSSQSSFISKPSSSSFSSSSSYSESNSFHFIPYGDVFQPESLPFLSSKKNKKSKETESQIEKGGNLEIVKKKNSKLEEIDAKKEKMSKPSKRKTNCSEKEKLAQSEKEGDTYSEKNISVQIDNDKKNKLEKEKQTQAKKKKEGKHEVEEEKKLEQEKIRKTSKKFEKEQQLEEKNERKIKLKIEKICKKSVKKLMIEFIELTKKEILNLKVPEYLEGFCERDFQKYKVFENKKIPTLIYQTNSKKIKIGL